MKLSDVIKTLQYIQSQHSSCDPEVELVQDLEVPVPKDFPDDTAKYIGWQQFFIVEEHSDTGWTVNLRTWPY